MSEIPGPYQEMAAIRASANVEQEEIEKISQEALAKMRPHTERLIPQEVKAVTLSLSSIQDVNNWFEENGFKTDEDEESEDEEEPFGLFLSLEHLQETARLMGMADDEEWRSYFTHLDMFADGSDAERGFLLYPDEMFFEQEGEESWSGGFSLQSNTGIFEVELALNLRRSRRNEVTKVSIDLPNIRLLPDSSEAIEYQKERIYFSQLPSVNSAGISYVITETAKQAIINLPTQE